MANRTDSASTISFGTRGETLLSERTSLTIRLGGEIDGPLGKSVLTHALRSTKDLPPLGSAASRPLARRSPQPQNVRWLVQML